MKNMQHATLEALYLAHKDHVYNYVYRLCQDHDTAQDIVQQTFLKLCNDPNLASLTHPKAYLFTVARNTLYDSWKKKREVRLDEHEEERYQDMNTDTANDPGTQIAQEQLRDKIDAYLMAMPEKSRELMVLRYMEDLSLREIAHVTSRTLSDVKVGLHRARHRFDEGFTHHMYAHVAASREQCDELDRLIEPWGDRDIPVAQLQVIESHIDSCQVCRDDATDMKTMRKLFATLPLVGIPLALDATLREAVAAEAMVHGATAVGASGVSGTVGTSSAAASGTSAAAGSKLAGGMGAKLAAGAVAAAVLTGGGVWLASQPEEPPSAEPAVAAPATSDIEETEEAPAGATVAVNASARLTRDGKPLARNLHWEVHRLSDNGEAPEYVTTRSGATPRFQLPPGHYRITVRDGEVHAHRRIEVREGEPVNVDMVLESGFLRVGARLAAGQPVTNASVRFEIHEADPDRDGNYPFITYAQPGRAIALPAGNYRLEVSIGLNTHKVVELEVSAGQQTVREDIVLDAGYLNLAARHRPGGPVIEDNVRFEITAAQADTSGSHKFIGYAPNGRNVILSAGHYRIAAYWGVNTETVTGVEVGAGKRTVRDDIILPGGYLKLGARLRPGGPLLSNKLRLEIYSPEPGPDGKYHFITYAPPGKPVQLAAGRYRVAAHFGLNAGTATEVTVRAGELTANEDIIIDGGFL
ncbi:MAG TPA: sigma-70 family RNA polymerase sigma factor, partial [Gammaproteobacteria bacterium]|nr:sigma-70 family RNA polymerase sigma factor [Gammaproteobacteria bacterium]